MNSEHFPVSYTRQALVKLSMTRNSQVHNDYGADKRMMVKSAFLLTLIILEEERGDGGVLNSILKPTVITVKNDCRAETG